MKKDILNCVQWSLFAGTIAYAIMLWQAGSTLSPDHMLMVGMIIAVFGFCFAADYYGSRLKSLPACGMSLLTGFCVFAPFGILRFTRLVLQLCLQMPQSPTLNPNGFGVQWEFVVLFFILVAFLISIGNSTYNLIWNKETNTHG